MVEEQTVEGQARPRLFGRFAWHRRRDDSLRQQTLADEVTGLRNQRALWHELDRRTGSCSQSHPLAVVMVDFDHLKDVNEAYGRRVGDAILQRGASVVRRSTVSPRLAFRFGGEEFVLLAEVGQEEARALAERVRTEIAAQNGTLPSVTVSCGVAYLDEPVEPWVALDRADAALREAKRSGRNRVAFAGRTSPGERAELVEELQRETARRAAMALAVATLEVRDRGTADHSQDVLTRCEAVGRRLGLDEPELQHLRSGAQLHDVGKVAIPSSILNKPGALTEEEWAAIREHTVIGERILQSVPEMTEVATIVRHSHEHWDGSGYPDGLAGDQIPAASRVILCADAFHAMRCDRPYRAGRPTQAALEEIEACAGTQFDPAVVEAFTEVVADARAGKVVGADGLRKKRLLVLLATLTIGGSSAVAGIPEVRDAIKSVFGSGTAPTQPLDGPALEGLGFGQLGDLFTLPPAKGNQSEGPLGRARRAAIGDRGGRHAPAGERTPRGAKFSAPGGSGGSGGGGLSGIAPAPGPTETTPTTDAPRPGAQT